MKKVIRVCGALIRNDKILMVNHQHDNKNYWTLPGGAVEINETLESAVERELLEETNLIAKVSKVLFDEDFNGHLCRCFLLNEGPDLKTETLGYDPEELNLPESERMLKKVEWKKLMDFQSDKQVSLVLQYIDTIKVHS